MDQDHDPDSPDRDDPAPGGPAGATPGPKRPGLVATILALASKLPIPSLGTERHEMVLDASPPTSPHAAGPTPDRPGTKRAAGRSPFLALKREPRVIAALISSVLLVGALLFKRGEKGEADTSILLALEAPAGGDPVPPAPGAKDDGAKHETPQVKAEKAHADGGKHEPPGKQAAEKAPGPGDRPRTPDSMPVVPPLPEPRPVGEPGPDGPATLPPPPTEGTNPAELGEPRPTTTPPQLPSPGDSTPKPPEPPPPANDPIPLPEPKPEAPASAAIPELPTPAEVKPKEAETNPAQVQAQPADPPPMSDPPAKTPADEPIQAHPAGTEAGPAPSMTPSPAPTPASMPDPDPVAPTGPVLAEKPPTLETVPAVGSIEPAATKASAIGALGAGWVAIPSGGRRIVGSVPIVSTPAEAQVDAPRVADGPRVVEDPAAVDQVEPVVHTVQPGENFWTISKTYYRSGRFYKALHAANRKQVPDIRQLWVGTVLRIPPPEALDRSLIDPPGRSIGDEPATSTVSRTSNSRRAQPPSPEEVDLAMPARPRVARPDPEAVEAPPRRPTYKVKPNETLRGIARDTLDDSKRFREIYNLNRDALDDIGAPLPAGTILTLPEDAIVGRRPR